MKPVIYIHTNNSQLIGAKLSEYTFKSRSAHPDKFDVRMLRLEETPHLYKREGDKYLRKGKPAVWHNNDLQSFSPLRRMVPQLMGFEGRALLVDPDVFALGDVYDLLSRDMEGKSILCKNEVKGYRGNGVKFYASSVMLLDCAKLKHWNWDEDIDALFDMKMDYGPWISLLDEPEDTIGELEQEWNHFDQLEDNTQLIHFTERVTQPWKTGLPIDFDTTWRNKKNSQRNENQSLFAKIVQRFLKSNVDAERYVENPDPNQIRLFMELLLEALDQKAVDEAFLHSEIKKKNLRPDIFKVMSTFAT